MGQSGKRPHHLGEIVILAPEHSGMSAGFSWRLTRRPVQGAGFATAYVQTTTRARRKMSCVGCTFDMTHRMGKLMRVTVGRRVSRAVDFAKGWPTLGKWWGVELSAEQQEDDVGAGKLCSRFLCLSIGRKSSIRPLACIMARTDVAIRLTTPISESSGQFRILRFLRAIETQFHLGSGCARHSRMFRYKRQPGLETWELTLRS